MDARLEQHGISLTGSAQCAQDGHASSGGPHAHARVGVGACVDGARVGACVDGARVGACVGETGGVSSTVRWRALKAAAFIMIMVFRCFGARCRSSASKQAAHQAGSSFSMLQGCRVSQARVCICVRACKGAPGRSLSMAQGFAPTSVWIDGPASDACNARVRSGCGAQRQRRKSQRQRQQDSGQRQQPESCCSCLCLSLALHIKHLRPSNEACKDRLVQSPARTPVQSPARTPLLSLAQQHPTSTRTGALAHERCLNKTGPSTPNSLFHLQSCCAAERVRATTTVGCLASRRTAALPHSVTT